MSQPSEVTPSAVPPGWERERGPSLIRAVWRYRYMVVAVALLAACVGYVRESQKPPVYDAASNILLMNPYDRTLFRQERGTAFTDIDRYLGAQAELVRSPAVVARASDILKGRVRPAEIRQAVTAQSSTAILEVTVRARLDDPTKVASIVNAVTEAYEDVATQRVKAVLDAALAEFKKLEAEAYRRLQELPRGSGDPSVEAEQNSLIAQITNLQAKQGQFRADFAVYRAGIERIDKARVPEFPVSDTPRRSAAIFGILGLIAALIAAFWRSERVRTVETGEDAASAMGAPLLGSLPRHPVDSAPAAAPILSAPTSPAAREYGFLASTLTLAVPTSERRVLLTTSLQADQAKSVAALNLALSAAQDQRGTVLLDVEPAGHLTRLLRADSVRGASDLVALSAAGFSVSLREGSMTPIESLEWFHFVPTGTRELNGRDVADSPQLAKVLVQLQQEADLVFVDGPALRERPGALKLAAAVDGVILVVRRGTRLEELRRAGTMLAAARAPVVGIIFDRSPAARWWRRDRLPRRRRRRSRS